jgi:hypothetical protein
MNRYVVLTGIALAALASSGAAAQTAKDLVGTWTLDSAGGFGPNPKGYVMFDANGHFGALLMRSDLSKYVSNRRTQGTAEEYEATRYEASGSAASVVGMDPTRLDLA